MGIWEEKALRSYKDKGSESLRQRVLLGISWDTILTGKPPGWQGRARRYVQGAGHLLRQRGGK